MNAICAMQFVVLPKEGLGYTSLLWPKKPTTKMFERHEKHSCRETKRLGKHDHLPSFFRSENTKAFLPCDELETYYVLLNLKQKSTTYCYCGWSCGTCWIILLPEQQHPGIDNTIVAAMCLNSQMDWTQYFVWFHCTCRTIFLLQSSSFHTYNPMHKSKNPFSAIMPLSKWRKDPLIVFNSILNRKESPAFLEWRM